MATSIEVYPDNWPAYAAFNAMSTQWLYRPCGMGLAPAVGLNYQSIPMAMRIAGIAEEKRDGLYSDLFIMEQAALAAMHEQ